jgi:hypothetical protein
MAGAHRQDPGGGGVMLEEGLHRGDGFCIATHWNGRYLRAHVFGGRDSLQVSSDVWRFLTAECERLGTRRLLAIEELDGTVPLEQLPALTEVQMACGFDRLRIAFVDLRVDVHTNELSELMLLEREVAVQVFNTEDEALRWLLYGVE